MKDFKITEAMSVEDQENIIKNLKMILDQLPSAITKMRKDGSSEQKIKGFIDKVGEEIKNSLGAISDIDSVQAARKELPKLSKQMENLNEGKKPKGYMAELAEIDKQSALVALEAKINKLAEMAEAKTNRLNMVNEDENLSELISKQAVKEMQRSIKEIEKLKEKLTKEFTKKGGKMTEVIDEEEKIDEMFPDKNKDGTYDISKVLDKAVHGDDVKRDPATGNPIKEDELEEGEEIEEGGYMPNYEEDSDGTMEEEVNEEVERFKKLAGI